MSKTITELALDWHRMGRGAVLATVIETWGSAPRQAGSQMLVDASGAMEGSVSGGCVEGAVVLEALAALSDGQGRVLTYGVSDADAFAAGLACGGTVRLMVEPVASMTGVLEQVVAAAAALRPVALVTGIAGFSHRLVEAGAEPAVDARLRSDKSGVEAAGFDAAEFVAVHNPPLRLIVVGAVHIAQALMGMARACGYAAVLIDPRTSFGAAERFPGEVIIDAWPDEALARLAPDARTAIVTLTHDPKLDDPAVQFALRSKAFYLGCLGSKGTHRSRVERLRAAGFSDEEIARIRAPVGLDIGAKSPAEIAVSVMAEVIQMLRRGSD